MAGQLLNVTKSITTHSATTAYWQPGIDALDVLGYAGNRFEFALKVYLLQGSGTPEFTAHLYTSMYNDDNEDTWTLLGSFAMVDSSNTAERLSVTSGVLRYVKWKVERMDITLVSFEILGVAW